MTTFEVLSGRLTLDTSAWQNALRQAQPALAQFVANMGRAMDVLKGGITSVATALGGITPALTGLTAAGVKFPNSEFRAPISDPMPALKAYGEAPLAQFKRNAELQGKDRETSLKNARDLQLAFEATANALKLGDKGLAEFQAAAKKAGEITKQLGLDLARLDVIQKKNAFHAAGKRTPDEQSAQLARQMWMKAALGPLARHIQEAAAGVFAQIAGGPGQLNQLIQDARDKGDPLGALDLIIQNVQMKVGQASSNLHVLASSGMLGNINGFPGVDNSAYLMSTGNPAAQALTGFQDLLGSLQQQRIALVKQLAHPKHHMAEGGIVNLPTVAQIGESGPEAVVPLNRLWQELRQGFGRTVDQFQSNFAFWTQRIGQQMNLGNFANVGLLENFAKQQDAMVQALVAFQQHRQIDLQPLRGSHVFGNLVGGNARAGRGGVYSGDTIESYAGPVNVHLTVHGVDMADSRAASKLAQQLVPHIDAAVKQQGTDMTGRSALRSQSQPFAAAPTGYAR